MKKNIFVINTALFFILLLSPISSGEVQYGSYINNNYNYEIIIPQSWSMVELSLAEKHFMYATKDANTEIKVRAFRSSDEDIEKTVHSETWDLRKVDPGLKKIIETERITIKENITGKLLIFEYRSKKKNFLQRTLLSVNNGIIYIIECKSPINTFYKYEDIFTTALASFKYIQGETRQNTSQSKEEIKKDYGLEEEPLEEDEKL